MSQKRKSHYERVELNPTQLKLYRSTLHGIKSYTQDELSDMTEEQKIFIVNKHTAVQKNINRWKQRRTVPAVDNLLLKLFPNSKVVKNMAKRASYTSNHYECINKLSFSDLGITQKQIIDHLIKWSFLPPNFYELS